MIPCPSTLEVTYSSVMSVEKLSKALTYTSIVFETSHRFHLYSINMTEGSLRARNLSSYCNPLIPLTSHVALLWSGLSIVVPGALVLSTCSMTAELQYSRCGRIHLTLCTTFCFNVIDQTTGYHS
jgi:hypothetical protein